MKIIELFRKLFDPGRPPKKVLEIMNKVNGIAFPRGQVQIDEEAELLYAVLTCKVPIADVKRILTRTKPLYYIKNCRRSDNTIRKIPDIIQISTKTSLSNTDLDLIHKFCENYFGFNSGDQDPPVQNEDTASDLESVSLYDQSGKSWGTVVFDSSPVLTKSGKEGSYQAVLFMSVLGAKQNLSIERKNMFSRLAGLPEEEWTEIHYRQFAFGFANWVGDPSADDLGSTELRKVKDSVDGFMVSQTVPYNSDEIITLYRTCLIALK